MSPKVSRTLIFGLPGLFGIPDHKYVCCLPTIKCMHIFALLFKFKIIKLLLCPSNGTKICTLWQTQRVSNHFFWLLNGGQLLAI